MTSRKAGFTLVEVVVASFGLALGLAGILISFSAFSRTARMVDAVNVATHRARLQMEQLRTCTFADPDLAAGTHSTADGFYVVSSASATSTMRRVTVTRYAVVPGVATSQVDLTTLLTSVLHQ